MAQPMKVSILIGADASGAKAGGAEAVAAIDKVSVAGERAAVSLVGVADAGGRAGAGFERSGAGANASATAIARIGQTANQSTASVRGLVEAQTGLSRAAANTDLRQADLAAYGAQLDALRAKYNPLYAAISRYKAEVAGIRQAHSVGAISTTEMTSAIERERRATLASIDAIKGRTVAIRTLQTTQTAAAASNNAAAFQTANIAAQFQDIGVTAAMGMSPLQIALQQGTQLSMVMASMQNPIRGLGAAFMSVLSPVSLLTIGTVAASAAAIQYFATAGSGSEKTARLLDEQNDVIRKAAEAWGAAVPAFKAYVDELDRVDKITAGREATEIIAGRSFDGLADKIGALQPEFTAAMRSLNQGADPVLVRDFRDAFANLLEKVKEGTATNADFVKAQNTLNEALETARTKELVAFEGAYDRITAAIYRAIKASEEARSAWIKSLAGGATVQDVTENNQVRIGETVYPAAAFIPRNPGVPTSRPLRELEGDGTESRQAEKTESAYQQLLRTADQRLAQVRNEIAIAGEATNVQERLRAEYEAEAQYRERIAQIKGAVVDEGEIAVLRQKAALLAEINGQLSAQRLLTSQRDQFEQLRLESQLIGASTDERTRATASLQAEQQLRQQGIDLMSQEAQAYRANAVAMAEARLQLERQQGAYQAAQQAGGTMIDQLTVGTGSLRDRLKSVADTLLTTFQQLAIANPLKNALLGQNNPTLGDLFTGSRTSAAPVTSTAAMTVTAGTVMINGTPLGVPGATTTLGGFLGAANNNQPVAANTNGVRPELSPLGIVNSPVAAAATAPGADVQSQVWNYWAAKGLQPHQIAGIMGNVQAESRFNPAAVGDNGAALGLAQWNDRGPAMTAAVPDWRTNVQGQLDFMNREFQTTENASWQRLTSATDVRSATAAMAGYERPLGYSATNPEGAHNFTGRLQGADAAMQKFGQTANTASSNLTNFGTGALDATKALNAGSQSITGSVNTLATQTAQVPQQSQGLFSSLFNSLGQGVQSIGSGVGSIFTGLFGGLFADGAAFSRGSVVPFANGTVIDRPTLFPMSGGRTGLMGEAGEEAIMPLSRGPGGRLGVTMALPRQARQGGEMRLNLSSRHEITINGTTDKELRESLMLATNEMMDIRDRNLRNSLPDQIREYQKNPWARTSG